LILINLIVSYYLFSLANIPISDEEISCQISCVLFVVKKDQLIFEEMKENNKNNFICNFAKKYQNFSRLSVLWVQKRKDKSAESADYV